MILLDTSVLIASLTNPRPLAANLYERIQRRERILMPAICLYEWLRGPRRPEELQIQEDLFPARLALPYGPDEAHVSARLYRGLPRARGREIDIAIAACAICHDARLWTINRKDFADIPGLQLV